MRLLSTQLLRTVIFQQVKKKDSKAVAMLSDVSTVTRKAFQDYSHMELVFSLSTDMCVVRRQTV
jgi:hypothetical protein